MEEALAQISELMVFLRNDEFFVWQFCSAAMKTVSIDLKLVRNTNNKMELGNSKHPMVCGTV